jgi:DNA repair protein RadD
MTTKPRPYQNEMWEAGVRYIEEKNGNGIIVSPTGTGKSLICNMLVKWGIQEIPGSRIMVTTHDRKIIAQNCQSMFNFWPSAPAGIFSAGLRQRDTRSPILFTGIQSVYKCPEDFGHIDCLIIDECHMLGPKADSMYGKFITGLKRVNPDLRILGFSASPYRMGQGLLTEGEIFDDIIIDMSTTERFCQFVDEGYLSKLFSKETETVIDLSEVPMQMGDFNEKAMEAVADTKDINSSVVREVMKNGRTRNHWMGFCSGVKHAEHLKTTFTAAGITAEVVHGKMSEEEQDHIEKLFRKGLIRCLLNVGIYNVGWDFDALDLIFVVRGTQSTSWWVQALGRGTRPLYAPGFDLETTEGRLAAIAAGNKPHGCLVLDFCGNTRRLGPINAPVIPSPRKKGDGMGGDAPVKVCKSCDCYNHTRATVCINCGEPFPPASCIEQTAAKDAVMISAAVAPVTAIMDVLSTHYSEQPSKQPGWGSLVKVSYGDLVNTRHEFFFPEAPLEWKRKEFNKFWITAGGQVPVPATAEQFIERARKELKAPKKVYYEANTKYKNVTKKEY